jgi:ribosomal protein S3
MNVVNNLFKLKAMKRFLFKQRTAIKHFLFPRTNGNSKQIRNDRRVLLYLRFWCDDNNIDIDSFQIQNIITKLSRKKLVITITLGRPGLLIGKGGRTIDSITKYLNKRWDTYEATIKIKESYLFR